MLLITLVSASYRSRSYESSHSVRRGEAPRESVEEIFSNIAELTPGVFEDFMLNDWGDYLLVANKILINKGVQVKVYGVEMPLADHIKTKCTKSLKHILEPDAFDIWATLMAYASIPELKNDSLTALLENWHSLGWETNKSKNKDMMLEFYSEHKEDFDPFIQRYAAIDLIDALDDSIIPRGDYYRAVLLEAHKIGDVLKRLEPALSTFVLMKKVDNFCLKGKIPDWAARNFVVYFTELDFSFFSQAENKIEYTKIKLNIENGELFSLGLDSRRTGDLEMSNNVIRHDHRSTTFFTNIDRDCSVAAKLPNLKISKNFLVHSDERKVLVHLSEGQSIEIFSLDNYFDSIKSVSILEDSYIIIHWSINDPDTSKLKVFLFDSMKNSVNEVFASSSFNRYSDWQIVGTQLIFKYNSEQQETFDLHELKSPVTNVERRKLKVEQDQRKQVYKILIGEKVLVNEKSFNSYYHVWAKYLRDDLVAVVSDYGYLIKLHERT